MTDIEINIADGLMELQLNRPAKKNAITIAMYRAMADAVEQAAADPAVRVLTIRGTPEIFSAGNDLRDFQQAPATSDDMPVFRFLRGLAACPKVVIAAVAGPAVGIGTTMLLHCDLVLAAPSATFSLPFVDLALLPEAASSLLLPRMIGRQRSARHLILGEPFDADTAFAYGIVTHLVPEAELETSLRTMALRVAAKPPEAVRITKQLLLSPDDSLTERIDREGALFAQRLASAEAAEAFAAFFEKRRPDFSKGS